MDKRYFKSNTEILFHELQFKEGMYRLYDQIKFCVRWSTRFGPDFSCGSRFRLDLDRNRDD